MDANNELLLIPELETITAEMLPFGSRYVLLLGSYTLSTDLEIVTGSGSDGFWVARISTE